MASVKKVRKSLDWEEATQLISQNLHKSSSRYQSDEWRTKLHYVDIKNINLILCYGIFDDIYDIYGIVDDIYHSLHELSLEFSKIWNSSLRQSNSDFDVWIVIRWIQKSKAIPVLNCKTYTRLAVSRYV